MLSEQNAREAIRSTAYSRDGEKIGKVDQLFLDDETGRPEWVTVNTGLFGTKETFIPIAEAALDGDKLTVPFAKDKVKDAPNVDADGEHLDRDEERRLYEYYGTGYDTNRSGEYVETNARDTTDTTTGGPETDDAMTRSEERLEVGKTSQQAGRARLRKYVTTEEETHSVPVRKEKAVLEREPVTEANRGQALDGPDISEEEHEVTLNEERVELSKTAEPVERVRLGTETATDEETVTDEVRKEHIETEGDVDERR